MARQYKTGLIITGDSSGGIKAIQATEKELGQLNKGFERGSRRAKQFGKDANETSRELEFLRNSAMSVGTAIAGAFAVNNLAGQAQMVAETDALARALSVSTGELQAWQYAGQQVGIQGDKMGDIFKDTSEKIGDFARTGGGEAVDLIEQMGLSIQELLRLSPDQQLLRIGEALQNLSPSERATFLESLADDAVRLQPLLKNNAEALREALDEADKLGVSMERADIEAAIEANRAMQRLMATVQGLSNALLADLGPGFADFTGDLTDFIQQAGGAEEILEGVGQAAGTLVTVYLARRLGPGLLSAGAKGLTMGRNIATGLYLAAGATGPLNRALVVTQARVAATATAGRALSSVVTLVGGPAGALMLAAGAAYTFRDELGLTIPKVDASSEAVHQLTGELDDMSRAAAENKLTQLNNQLADLKATAEDAGQAALDVGKEDTGHGGVLGADVAGQVKQLQEISETAKPVRQDVANVEEAIGLVEDRLEQLNDTGDRTPPTLTRISEASKEAAEREKQFASSLATLEDRLFPATAAQRDFLQSQLLLQTGLMKGEIGIDRYLEAWQRLNTERSRNITGGFMERVDTGGLAKEVEETSGAARDLGLTFTSAFEDAAIEGENFRGVLQGIFEDIQRIIIRRSITEPAEDAISGALDGFSWGDIGSAIGGILGGGGATVDTSGVSAMGFNTGSFSAGGYTGDGGTHEPAGIVHRGEYVVKKSVVEQPGVLPMLERLNRMPGYAAGGYVGGRAMPMASGDLSVHIHNEGGEAIQVGRREERRGGDGRRELHLWVNRAVDQRIDQRFADGSLDRTMRNNYGARRQSK
ncbi:hypothetical protein QWY79_10185 [Halomonas sabkhae]|uniref:hypothetical protein n=1 Tax=Halomonas sabkhae TaxID=626223 RepID=UPI0025B4DC41|nr:hypothetical protein [Halomonas sabkhae]MDN3525632.1 hypothetical protein [Halomonas sabkhae]